MTSLEECGKTLQQAEGPLETRESPQPCSAAWEQMERRQEVGIHQQLAPTPVLLPGKFHGWRSLVGCSPWGREESDTTERLHFHFSLSCTGEGNGNPLQRSCLENPRDGGAWWAAVHGVTQSRTRPKRLSSSNSILTFLGPDAFIKTLDAAKEKN